MRYSWPALVWLLIVLVLTLIPGPAIPDVGFSFRIDKIVHFFLFGIQMVLTAYALEKHTLSRGAPAHPILVSVIFSIAAGVGIEFLQRFVPGRSFSVFDMVANTIGVGIGYYVFRYLKKHNRL
jgi:VanZ family protein